MSKSKTSNNACPPPGLLLVLSAPSGAGKSTVLRRLRALETNFGTTISATTRQPRPGEQHGRDYYFRDEANFQTRRAAGDFVEWATVHGNYYGTLYSELDRCRSLGQDVLLEIDVQGMRLIREQCPDVITIFLMPPSLEELERRLRARGTDDEATIALRLKNAEQEMAAQNEYDHVVVNDNLDRAVAELRDILWSSKVHFAQ